MVKDLILSNLRFYFISVILILSFSFSTNSEFYATFFSKDFANGNSNILATDCPESISISSTVRINVADPCGNPSPPPPSDPPPDTVKPSVSLTSPVDNEIISGPIWLSAVASDNVRVNTVYFYVDNNNIGQDINSPYEKYFDPAIKNWVEGSSHSIYAKAVDSSGNTQPSTTVTVCFKCTPAPSEVEITRVYDLAYNDKGVYISWDVSQDQYSDEGKLQIFLESVLFP